MLELAPEGILVMDIVIKSHLDNCKSVSRRRCRLFLVNFGVSKNKVFERLGGAILDLIHIRSRVRRNHDALTHRETRKFVLSDLF